jgi:hypothetical protein
VEPMFLSRLDFNDEARRDFFKLKNLDGQYSEDAKEEEIDSYQERSFLSKALYYEFLNDKK